MALEHDASQIAPPRRFPGLDGIRGIAALLVALRHIPFLGPVVFPEAFLAVDVFFVLSGVVLCDAYGSKLSAGLTPPAFMLLRLIRVYPLYLLGTLVGLLAIMTGADAAPAPVMPMVALGLVMVPYLGAGLFPLDGPAWSLFLEMVAGTVYGTLARVGSATMLLGTIAICGLGLVFQFVLLPSHTLDLGWTPDTLAGGFLRIGFSFATGVLLHHLYERTRPSIRGAVAETYAGWVVIGLVAALLMAVPPARVRPAFELAAVLVIVPSLVFAALFFQPGRIGRRICEGLGAISYPLYTLHAPMAQTVERIASRAGFSMRDHAPWSGLLFMVALTCLCFWLDARFDRPIRRRLTSLLADVVTARAVRSVPGAPFPAANTISPPA